ANVEALFGQFDLFERESARLIEAGLPLPAYQYELTASHTINLLDACKAISVTERQRFILRVRTLARAVADAYFKARQALGFPMADAAIRDEVLAQLAQQADAKAAKDSKQKQSAKGEQ